MANPARYTSPAVPRVTVVVVLAACSLVFACAPRPRAPDAQRAPMLSDTLHYVVVSNGQISGSVRSWTDSNGEWVYATRDANGHELITRARMDDRSLPTSLHTIGRNADGETVEERFSIAAERATWWNQDESGDVLLTDPAVYFPLEQAALPLALPALLAAPGHRLPALPRGELALEKELELVVAADDSQQRLTQYVVRGTGLGFYPRRVWLDSNNVLFSDLSLVPPGWEHVLPVLTESATRSATEDLWRHIRALRRAPLPALVIRNASVLDVENRAVLSGMAVLIEGSRISRVAPDASVTIPAGAEVIDANGRLVMPGLWDMHSHNAVGIWNFTWDVLNLAAGVTTVRDMGMDTAGARQLNELSNEQIAFAPRLFWAGTMAGTAGSERTARELVRKYAEAGASAVKITGFVDRELMKAIIEEAHALELRVVGHLAPFMTVEHAVRAGIDEISHIGFLAATFAGDSVDWRRGRYINEAAIRAGTLDIHADSIQRLIRLIRDHGVAIDPTLTITEFTLNGRRGELPPLAAAVAARLTVEGARRWSHGSAVASSPLRDVWHPASNRRLSELVRSLHDAGVPLLPGSDELPGFALQREMELFVDAGIPAVEVLYLATLGAARVMGRERELGSVAGGKRADLILIDGDPTQDIGDIRRVVLTIKDGAIYDPSELYAVLGIRPCCETTGPSRRK